MLVSIQLSILKISFIRLRLAMKSHLTYLKCKTHKAIKQSIFVISIRLGKIFFFIDDEIDVIQHFSDISRLSTNISSLY